MGSLFPILERALLFAAVLMLIGYALFAMFQAAGAAAEQVRANAPSTQLENHTSLNGILHLPLEGGGNALILASHK